jgi:hypothetical protein
MSNTAQKAESNVDLAAQERPKNGAFKHYCATAIIVASIPATLAWTAFVLWAVLRIGGIL